MSKLKFQLVKSAEDAATQIVGAQTAEDIANLLEVPKGQLLHILFYAYPNEKKYLSFDIEKKNGGFRHIKAAKGGLRALQGKLAPILVSHYKPRNPVHGFLKGRSIVTNAKQHKRKRYVFNVDLEDFYGSINFGRLRGLFRAKPFNMGEKAAASAQICTFENSLPQGAATSPVISNFITSELDRKLSSLARRYKLTYTRYADDITFSSNNRNFPEGIAFFDGNNPITNECYVGAVLEETIQACGFSINHSKTRSKYAALDKTLGVNCKRVPKCASHIRAQHSCAITCLEQAWPR